MKVRPRVIALMCIFIVASNDIHAITPPGNEPESKPAGSTSASKSITSAQTGALELDWDELLPEEERDTFALQPPPPTHDYLGEQGPAAAQGGSAKVNRKLDNVVVKIPGYIVPLEMDAKGVTREFLLVPYFGACIHVPPPPPNQIIHVRMKRGVRLETIYDPQWITGRLKTSPVASRIASTAYTMDGDRAELYQY